MCPRTGTVLSRAGHSYAQPGGSDAWTRRSWQNGEGHQLQGVRKRKPRWGRHVDVCGASGSPRASDPPALTSGQHNTPVFPAEPAATVNLQTSAAKAQPLWQVCRDLLSKGTGTGQGCAVQTGRRVLPCEFSVVASAAQLAPLHSMSCLTGGRLGNDDEFTTSHPLPQRSLEPQMLTEGVVGAAVWMNNFPALQLRATNPRGGERDNKTVKQTKPPAWAAQRVLDRAVLFFIFSLLAASSHHPPPSAPMQRSRPWR